MLSESDKINALHNCNSHCVGFVQFNETRSTTCCFLPTKLLEDYKLGSSIKASLTTSQFILVSRQPISEIPFQNECHSNRKPHETSLL